MGARFKNLQQELTKVLKDGDVITGILDGDGERKPILDEAAKMLEGRRLKRPIAMLGYIQHFASSTLTKLLDPLLKPDVDIDPELQSDLVKTVFYLSSHEENKTFIVDLLAQGDDSAFDAVSSLCVLEENRDRAVLAGAVRVLTQKLQADAMVDHSLSLLALLSTSLKFLRRSTYQPNVENALVIIFNVSERDGSRLEFVSKEEKQKRTLTSVVVSGSEHAQTMALRILQVAAGSRR
ncbi:unnamed protein product [Brassica rapa]|uniref:Uncharacterized protein n=1 Tax=Brassica campestris TaxID=3711 RepID=A0A8D9H024_BRACM|nr:unnamed protein product [Brassica rapa]